MRNQNKLAGVASAAFVAVCFLLTVPGVSGQQTGSVEFALRVTPTSGQAEPVRGMTIFLLRKSFAEIRKETEAAEPAPDMNAFIDKLEVSPELRAWMKKHQRVELSGPEFPKQLTPDDVLNIPEFSKAFSDRNSGDRTIRLPDAKYLKTDPKKYPDKYALELKEYHDELRHFIETHPETLESLDIALDEVKLNPGPRWQHLQMERTARVHRRTMELAGTVYLAATTDTDLDGHGRFAGVGPGEYWLSTLETEAISGDAHVRWDFPVNVSAGKTAAVQLSNLNGVEIASHE
jgi:hypothetical protein